MVFGDVFRQRADYSKGLFYSGRNGIFSHAPNPLKVHPEGPQIVRKSLLLTSTKEGTTTEPTSSANSVADLNQPQPQTTVSKESEKLTKEAKNKPSAAVSEKKTFANILTFKFAKDHSVHHRSPKKKNNTIIIENNWKLEEFGGVKTWVNQLTGEVSLENPNKDLQEQTNGNPTSLPQQQTHHDHDHHHHQHHHHHHHHHHHGNKAKVMKTHQHQNKSKNESSFRRFFQIGRGETHKKILRFGISSSGKMKGSSGSGKGSTSIRGTIRNPEMKDLFAMLDGKKDESQKVITKPLQA